MKKVAFYTEGDPSPNEFLEEEEDVEKILNSLQEIFSTNNIVAITFSNGSMIIRPNKIVKIVVTDGEKKSGRRTRRSLTQIETESTTEPINILTEDKTDNKNGEDAILEV